MKSAQTVRRVIVDRVEDGYATLERQRGVAATTIPLSDFPAAAEGGIYDVPVLDGRPRYWEAQRRTEVEQEIKATAAKRLVELSQNDPGGDLAL